MVFLLQEKEASDTRVAKKKAELEKLQLQDQKNSQEFKETMEALQAQVGGNHLWESVLVLVPSADSIGHYRYHI